MADFMMRSIVRKAHSLYVSMPPKILVALSWKRGDQLALLLDGSDLVLRKVKWDQLALQLQRDKSTAPKGAKPVGKKSKESTGNGT